MGNTRILIAMPATEVATCPSSRAPMSTHRFMRKLVGEVEPDLCFSGQGIRFDEQEYGRRGQRRRERGSVHDGDIGDLLLDGVAMVWNMVQR